MEDSMENEVLLCSLTFFAVWWCYGFKWAILILFTLWLVKFAANNYPNVDFLAKESIGSYQNHRAKSSTNLDESFKGDETTDVDSAGRSIRTIRRRYTNPVSVKRDLPFTDLQMNRILSPRRGTSLKSSEPLISQITRHLSFSNVSYYPDRTRTKVLAQQGHNSALNTTRPNNSYLLSPIKSHNTSLNDMTTERKPSFDIGSSPLQARYSLSQERYSPLQERYSPRCFSVLDPTVNMVESPSTVKIAQPSEAVEGSPLSFESILQKRLQRTKENPCSRQAVLSALVEKSRKRTAYEVDGSFLEPTYGIKKRRRDNLDDFLDSISDSSSPAKISSSFVKSLKRPHLHSNDEETLYTSLRTDKRSRERQSSSEEQCLDFSDKETNKLKYSEEDKDLENTSNNLSNYDFGNTEDSGVVLSISDDPCFGQGKTKKGKSVTFSPEVQSQSFNIQDRITNSRTISSTVHSNLSKKPCPTENEQVLLAKKSAEFLPVFQARFSPRNSLRLNNTSPITKAKEKKGRRKSYLTWKDFQENRREAWRRSQKLLDDIEESIAREKGEPSGSLINQAASSNTGTTMVNDNVKKVELPNSNLFGSTSTQGLPAASLSTSLLPSTNTNFTLTSTTDTLLKTVQPVQEKDTAVQLTLQNTSTTPTLLSSRSLPSKSANSSASTTPNSGVMFGVSPAVSLTTTSSVAAFNFMSGSSGTSENTSNKVGPTEFMFAVPKSPVKKSTVTTTTSLTKPLVSNVFTSSASPFSGFGASATGNTAVQLPPNTKTTLNLETTSSNFAGTAFTGAVSTQFDFLNNAANTVTSQPKANLSTLSFKASLSSAKLPPTTSASSFTFKPQPEIAPGFQNNTQPTPLSSSQNKAVGPFSFGGSAPQSSGAPSFGSQSGENAMAAAGQAKPGGFSIAAPAVNKTNAVGGFNFSQNQATPGTFNFGTAPAAGGFTFGGAGARPGAPFASSTPMPGISGGLGAAFTLGSVRSPGGIASKQRPRRRRK